MKTVLALFATTCLVAQAHVLCSDRDSNFTVALSSDSSSGIAQVYQNGSPLKEGALNCTLHPLPPPLKHEILCLNQEGKGLSAVVRPGGCLEQLDLYADVEMKERVAMLFCEREE